MAIDLTKKCTVLVPSGPSHNPDGLHLFVVCNDPCEHDRHLIVPISTFTNALCDQTCLLEAHEHPFLRHRSYILYRKAQIEDRKTLLAGIELGHLIQREVLNSQSFLRVVNGVCRSPQTPRRIKNYFGCIIPQP